ncbi:myosin-9-like isoform X1 [Cydia amplana]|uniref:myosin-9-like isoform X1 n=1 Tax=Cydia amplana TaxID=1869771 RepID=UPI002FE5E1C8
MPQTEYWPFGSYKKVDDPNFKEDSSVLQKQLGDMEGEVKEIQMELAAIRNERLDVSSRKRRNVIYGSLTDAEEVVRDHGPGNPVAKYPEILKMREDLVRAKNAADEERTQREKYEEKLKDLERKLNDICSVELVEKGTRDYTNQDVGAMKTQIRDMREEIEELRFTVNEKSEQLQEYRMRYLQAQQQVEEARRQRELIEFDNKQVTDQIHIEIQKMKLQFQEKLQELAQLPDLLKGAQIQLQESKQLQKLAEESTQQFSNELQLVREKLVHAVNSFNQEKAEKDKLSEENKFIKIALLEKDHEIDGISKELDEYKSKAFRFEEKLTQQEVRYKEKAAECAQILKDLDELRAESSRSLTRLKERSESNRRYMQAQITELEKQLIQSRAQCRASQKERDDIRQRMQMQISSLQENFELVEIRLRGLQNQVGSLKHSYSYILTEDSEDLTTSLVES